MTDKAVKTKTGLVPAPGYLLIKPLEAQTKTDSGIYLPDTAGEKPQKGKVLAVGSDEITENGTVRKSFAKVGDVVFYKKWGGNEVRVDNVDYLFAKFEDVFAVEEQ